jgi:DNA-binding CsgD family transcriptional regulator
VRTRASALIGRIAELAAAANRLRGDGPACFLIGEPGVGKSRLLAEVSQQARADGLIVARGRASSVGPVSPLRPFAEALAGIHRSGLLPDDNLGGYRPLLARVLPELTGPASGEAPPLVAFAEAVLRLLSTLGGSAAGCLLVLEDLHDADPDSLAVLEYLLDNAGPPIALLGALRDEPSQARELLVAAERRGAAELLPIRPLDRLHTDLLVAACLGTDRPAVPVTELAWRNTAGNPLAVEELLYHLIDDGQLDQRGVDWQLSPTLAVAPPPSMLQLIGSRLSRMDQLARQLVVTAAVYGEQFPLPTTRATLGIGETGFLYALRDAIAAQLIVAERPGWCRFHHPLTHAAMLELVHPTERRRAATALAETILTEDPERTGPTCRAAARLLVEAGQLDRAGDLYAHAGKLALGSGSIEVAVADLGEAMRLQAPDKPPPPALLSDLVRALWRAGQFDRALELVDQLAPAQTGLDRQHRAKLHVDLAWACGSSGKMEQARLQLARARTLAAGTNSALLDMYSDATAARLSFRPYSVAAPTVERLARTIAEAAERLTRTAVDATERAMAAEVTGRASAVLLLYLQNQDRHQEEVQCRQRMASFAEEHGIASWVLDLRCANLRAASIIEQCWEDGDDLPVRAYRDQVREQGDVMHALSLDRLLWLHETMVSDGSLASVVNGLTDCIAEFSRLGDDEQAQWAQSGLLTTAALRADRSAMRDVITRYRTATPSPVLALDMRISSAFCLALEGRDGEALSTLRDLDRRNLIGPYYTSFPLGLLLLLGTLTGATSPEQITLALTSTCQIRWTRLFLHWAAAVHAGRRSDRAEVQRHAALAAQAAEIYPVARHLAARLVAPAAVADGWGHPIEDLRAAEAWFHEQGVTVAARTCRDLLRSLGVPVQQRRNGTAGIPADLRAAGITVREYEVGMLLREHLGNRDIGQRLHISPRTVEKHIAGLTAKLNLPDRRALIDRMADGEVAGNGNHNQPRRTASAPAANRLGAPNRRSR